MNAGGVRAGRRAVSGVVRGPRPGVGGDRPAPRGRLHSHTPWLGPDRETTLGRDPRALRLARRQPGPPGESRGCGAGAEARRPKIPHNRFDRRRLETEPRRGVSRPAARSGPGSRGGGRRVCHGAPATSAPVDHASRTGWGRTVRLPRYAGHGRGSRRRGTGAARPVAPEGRRA